MSRRLKMPARYRGHIELVRDPQTGMSLCIACKSCEKACPSDCIVVDGIKREGDKVVFPTAQAGAASGYLDAVKVTWDDTPTGRGPVGTAIRENRAAVVDDTRTDPQFELWRSEAVPRGFLSLVGLPMRAAGEVIGIEIEPKYFAIAVRRVRAELERFPLFEQAARPRQLEFAKG